MCGKSVDLGGRRSIKKKNNNKWKLHLDKNKKEDEIAMGVEKKEKGHKFVIMYFT